MRRAKTRNLKKRRNNMATTHARRTTTKTTKEFDSPTILVNCMTPCSRCDALRPLLNDSFIKYCGSLGYSLCINETNSKTTEYWKKYGKPRKVGQATPQMYAIDGSKAAGVSLVPGEVVGGYEIPATSKWNLTFVKKVTKLLVGNES